MSTHRRSEEDVLLARYVRFRKPRDFARLFDRTAPRLLRRAQQIDPNRANELVNATYRALLFAQTGYTPNRRCIPFLLDVLLQHGLPAVSAALRRLPRVPPAEAALTTATAS